MSAALALLENVLAEIEQDPGGLIVGHYMAVDEHGASAAGPFDPMAVKWCGLGWLYRMYGPCKFGVDAPRDITDARALLERASNDLYGIDSLDLNDKKGPIATVRMYIRAIEIGQNQQKTGTNYAD